MPATVVDFSGQIFDKSLSGQTKVFYVWNVNFSDNQHILHNMAKIARWVGQFSSRNLSINQKIFAGGKKGKFSGKVLEYYNIQALFQKTSLFHQDKSW